MLQGAEHRALRWGGCRMCGKPQLQEEDGQPAPGAAGVQVRMIAARPPAQLMAGLTPVIAPSIKLSIEPSIKLSIEPAAVPLGAVLAAVPVVCVGCNKAGHTISRCPAFGHGDPVAVAGTAPSTAAVAKNRKGYDAIFLHPPSEPREGSPKVSNGETSAIASYAIPI